MDKQKISLHTSYDKRKKQGRTAHRDKSWGKGFINNPKISLSLFKISFLPAWLAIASLFILVKILPYKCLLSLGRLLGRLFLKLSKGRVYVVKQNLRLCYPQWDDKKIDDLTYKIFENIGMGIFETGMAWFWSDKKILKLAHIDELELNKARENAKNHPRTIVLTGHFVTLELGARIYALLLRPGVGVYRSSDHPVYEYIQVKGRTRSNVALVDKQDPLSMVRALMKGYPIWYAPDQDYGLKGSVFAPFFAVDKTCTVTGTHDMARIKGACVQPFWPIRTDKGYSIRILDILDNFPSEDVLYDTTRCNKIIEAMIKTAPEQYIWMHRRFKTTPEGEKSRYPKIEN